jgi:DNA-binding NarL/FixJ family response regulator
MEISQKNGESGMHGQDPLRTSGAAVAGQRPDLLQKVSSAQQRVLEYLLAGLTEPQIAEKLQRSRHTVHDHTKAIYSALEVSNRVQLVLRFSQPTALVETAART